MPTRSLGFSSLSTVSAARLPAKKPPTLHTNCSEPVWNARLERRPIAFGKP